jgi:hypothetical protein
MKDEVIFRLQGTGAHEIVTKYARVNSSFALSETLVYRCLYLDILELRQPPGKGGFSTGWAVTSVALDCVAIAGQAAANKLDRTWCTLPLFNAILAQTMLLTKTN